MPSIRALAAAPIVLASLLLTSPVAGSGAFVATGDSRHVGGLAFHSATPLADGRVFVTGGRNETGTFFHGELFDPTTGRFSIVESSDETPRSDHRATLLRDGRVLVTGGRGIDGSVAASASLYSPAAGTWTLTGSMASPRFDHTATLLRDGRVLIAGGEGARGGNRELTSAELFDPARGSFAPTGSREPGAPTGGMSVPRSVHTATLLRNGKVLIAGGVGIDFTGVRGRRSVELFNPTTGDFTAGGLMEQSRFGHTATLLSDGRVLIAGGANTFGTALAFAEVYDPTAGTFVSTGSMSTPRFGHTATLLPNGLVLIAGGQSGPTDASARLASVELYDPETKTFSLAGSMAVSRSFHTASQLPGGEVLLLGGQSGQIIDFTYLSSAERYRPTPAGLTQAPSFASFLAGDAAAAATLGWRVPDAATRFEFCSASSASALPESCSEVAGAEVTIDWDEVIEEAGSGGAVRTFSSGWRHTALRACNASGCAPLGAGPLAGGLEWPAWGIDFDYFALAFDVSSRTQFTIAGVVNLSDTPRSFELTNGTVGDPGLRSMKRCDRLPPGASCIAFLGPFDGVHFGAVGVVSSGDGTPTTLHRIVVR